VACDHLGKKNGAGELVEGAENPLTSSSAFRDTVAEVAWVEGLRRMRVRGYGIVAGLGTRGSSECPRNVRDRLLQTMYKMEQFARMGRAALPVTPEQILDDRDTAVVTVEGEIPSAVLAGTRFDLAVRALPGTQTVSLEAGRLYTCDLHIQSDLTGRTVTGSILARGSGPVFVNPWSKSDSAATRADPRMGTVLGGGVVTEDRRIRLVLEDPSYRRAKAVATCINTRFPCTDRIADAETAGHVRLRIPVEYAKDPTHFLEVVRHLYLPTTVGFLDRRAAALAQELTDPNAPHRNIALALEGIGRPTLPLLRELYDDPRDYVNFHAGLVGLRLDDSTAAEPVAAHALDTRSQYRIAAIKALAGPKALYRPARTLRRLIDDPDPRIRVLAYQGLLARGDECVVSRSVGGDNFCLDILHSSQRPLVYARRTKDRRIALFCSDITCLPPLFFSDEDGMITITAEEGDEQLTLVRKTSFGDRSSPPIPASLDVADLILMLGDEPVVKNNELVRGLNVPYSLVVKALSDLCELQAINADFMLQQTTVPEIFGPVRKPGRGESDI
jgi:hypothetical protein